MSVGRVRCRLLSLPVLALLFWGAPLAGVTPAQTLAPQDQAWRITSFLDDAGLRGRGILGLDFEPDDTVWIAATDGLYRYNGYLWKHFTAEEHGLPSNNVRSVLSTSSGELWVGTDRGAGVFEDERFRALAVPSSLAGPSVRRMVETRDGALWFCCDRWPDFSVGGGLSRLKDGEWRTWTEADGLPSDYVQDFFEDSAGRRFVLTDRGLAQLEGDRLSRPLEEAGLEGAGDVFWSAAESPRDGLVMAATDSRFVLEAGVWRRVAGRLEGVSFPTLTTTRDGSILACTAQAETQFLEWRDDAFISATVGGRSAQRASPQMVAEAFDGSIWAVGENLLSRWQRSGGEWDVFSDLPPPRLEDARGAIWFADDSRVMSLSDGQWQSHEGLYEPLYESPTGEIWALTSTGLARLDSETRDEFTEAEIGLRRPRIVGASPSGAIWAAGTLPDGRAHAVSRLDGEGWHAYPVPLDAPPPTRFPDRPLTGDGVWHDPPTTASPRLFFLEGSRVTEIPFEPGQSIRHRPGLLHDRSDRLWAYGRLGLTQLDLRRPTAWKPVDLPGTRVLYATRSDDAVCFAYRGMTGGISGLSSLTEGEWSHTRRVIDRVVSSDTEDTKLVCATPNGLQTVHLDRGGAITRLALPVDGLVESAVCVSDRELWVGIGGLVYRFRSDGIPPDTIAIEQPLNVAFGDTPFLRVRGVERYKSAAEGDRCFVSTSIDGGDWSAPQPISNDGIALAGLPIGPHEVHVRVSDEGSDFDPQPATFTFEIHAIPFQGRWWFWPATIATFVALLVLGIASLAARRKIATRANELEDVVRLRTAELSASETKYRRFFEQCPLAIVLFDHEAAITDGNPAAEALFGLPKADLLGRPFASLFENSIGDHFADPGSIRELIARKSDNTFCDVRMVLHRTRTEDGQLVGFEALLRDITEQKRLERRLNETHKMEAVGRLAGGIAHDFNNLLTVILGNAEMMKLRTGGDSKLTDSVEAVLGAAHRARRLTSQLQTFSRGKLVKQRVVDLNRIVEDVGTLLRNIIGEDIELSTDLSTESARVKVDPGQLEQVLTNLAINARDAMPRGGQLRLSTRIVEVSEGSLSAAGVAAPGRFVRLVVSDTGNGMDQATLQRIFEPFFTTKKERTGTGLGLATVYGILTQCDASVTVESSPGAGACFQLYFPFRTEPEEVEARVTSPAVEPLGGEETVLVVEDEEGVRRLLEEMLSSWGYHVSTAANGAEALALVEREPPRIDLLLTDIVMPGMDGCELARRFGELLPGTAVIFMTGYSRSRLLDDVDATLLSKPISAGELKRAVRQVLDGAAAGWQPQR